MSHDTSFPLLFTVDGSGRHELIVVNAMTSLNELTTSIANLAQTSPNCEEFMAKYKKSSGLQKVTEVRVKWSGEGRDRKIWPSMTKMTDDNVEAVMRLLASSPGRDVIDVSLVEVEKKETKKKDDA